ncbi:hypothetical protein ACWG5P_26615 [Streptomyces prasinus]
MRAGRRICRHDPALLGVVGERQAQVITMIHVLDPAVRTLVRDHPGLRPSPADQACSERSRAASPA